MSPGRRHNGPPSCSSSVPSESPRSPSPTSSPSTKSTPVSPSCSGTSIRFSSLPFRGRFSRSDPGATCSSHFLSRLPALRSPRDNSPEGPARPSPSSWCRRSSFPSTSSVSTRRAGASDCSPTSPCSRSERSLATGSSVSSRSLHSSRSSPQTLGLGGSSWCSLSSARPHRSSSRSQVSPGSRRPPTR